MDGPEESDASPEPLAYPWAQAPVPGHAVEVADGVLWLRMPLPFALDHINVWALRDGDRWTVVDTGMQGAQTLAAWESAMAGPLQGLPVTRVISTHMHPDHVGMAGWFTRRFGCRLWMTRLEYLTCRVLVADTGREAPADAVRFYAAAGWSERALEHYRTRFGGFGKGVYTLPDSYRRVVDGDVISIGGRDWRAVIGRGHSPEHLCLHCPELRVLISGDQVLPRISSNVSVFPTEPDGDPLAEWLDSLALVARMVPDDVLVLPAHNLPFRGLHRRLAHLQRGHERGLARVREALAEPRRVVDLFSALYKRPIGDELLGLATGEALAHLNYLLRRGQALRRTDEHGIHWYSRL
ncbi:MAG TPA: MBL fold metallo-hydrolase [Nevskiaceae bacterium]|nr:MBL fold metallo-hydrolase [Nevskiaceae bacterium]